MGKVVLVVCDALRDDTAAAQMGYLESLVEARLATRYTVLADLPTMSRPLYETLHTGMPSSRHGITTNRAARPSAQPHLFGLAHRAGRTTAASAFCWFSELYNRAPYDLVLDREVDDESLPIQHGRFYWQESYPDAEVFLAGAMLLRRFQPDYLLIHPMGMDHAGETFGANSAEYRNQAVVQDQIMAELFPAFLALEYSLLITADHGINDDRMHGGTRPDVRHVPLYLIRPGGEGEGNSYRLVSQLQIAPTICRLLGLPIPETMAEPPLL
jgi:predicted AlkP superfamily pyrophosphatase or phosphodiesterase